MAYVSRPLLVDGDGDALMLDDHPDESASHQDFHRRESFYFQRESSLSWRPSPLRPTSLGGVTTELHRQHPSNPFQPTPARLQQPAPTSPFETSLFGPSPFGNFRHLPAPFPSTMSRPPVHTPRTFRHAASNNRQAEPSSAQSFLPTDFDHFHSTPMSHPVIPRFMTGMGPDSVFFHVPPGLPWSDPPRATAQTAAGNTSLEETDSQATFLRPRDSLELIDESLSQQTHRPGERLDAFVPPARSLFDTAVDMARSMIEENRETHARNAALPGSDDAASRLPQPETPRRRHRRRMSRPPMPVVACTACMEDFKLDQLVNVGCSCRYCLPCLNAAFRAGCTNMASFPPKCCGKPLRISVWGTMLDPDILTRYKEIEAEFSTNRPLYCGFSKCSAFIPEEKQLAGQDMGICPQCGLATCRKCRRPMKEHHLWGENIRFCPAEDAGLLALYALGTEKKWKQCPTCLNMVERSEGCNHMDCVCGVEFCYRCGKLFDEDDACDCDPNSWEEDYSEGEDSEENEDHEDSEEEDWPDYRAAVDPLGRPACLHLRMDPLGEDVDFRCHGCLKSRPLRSCTDCGLELCERCVDKVQAGSDMGESEEGEEEDGHEATNVTAGIAETDESIESDEYPEL